jgi:hypothetical protein
LTIALTISSHHSPYKISPTIKPNAPTPAPAQILPAPAFAVAEVTAAEATVVAVAPAEVALVESAVEEATFTAFVLEVDDLVEVASALLAPTALVVVEVPVRVVVVFTAEEADTSPSGAVYSPVMTLPLLPSSWWYSPKINHIRLGTYFYNIGY